MRRAIFIAAFMLASCGAEAEPGQPQVSQVAQLGGGAVISVWSDREGGCDYLILSQGGEVVGITPRLMSGTNGMCWRAGR